MYITDLLLSKKDEKYGDFTAKLNPLVDRKTVIGVRLPELRNIAKEYSKNPEHIEFMNMLPHKYFEENFIHAFLIEQIKDMNVLMDELKRFLPYVDNWAVCDSTNPKAMKKCGEQEIKQITSWVKSNEIYTMRFGVNMLMRYFLDDRFDKKYLELVSKVKLEDYYAKMMVAWYFATALAKQWNDTIPFIENKVLMKWTHNKTIQKAIESYRITPEQKEYLRSLKLK